MNKTAREVMTPATTWPADELSDAASPRVSGGGLSGQAAGMGVSGGGLSGQVAGTGETRAIGVDDWVDRALATMTELKVRRLPVVDRGRLVGTVTQGDLASAVQEAETWSRLCS